LISSSLTIFDDLKLKKNWTVVSESPEQIRQNGWKSNNHHGAPKYYYPEKAKSLGWKEKKLWPGQQCLADGRRQSDGIKSPNSSRKSISIFFLEITKSKLHILTSYIEIVKRKIDNLSFLKIFMWKKNIFDTIFNKTATILNFDDWKQFLFIKIAYYIFHYVVLLPKNHDFFC
jgi:hypothetical protein